jgi:hypothetical protein
MVSELLGVEGATVLGVGAGCIASAFAEVFTDASARVLLADLEHNGGSGILLDVTDASSCRESVRTAQQPFGAALRHGNTLSHRRHEIAILELAQLERWDFERSARERLGRAIGFTSGEPHFSVSSV